MKSLVTEMKVLIASGLVLTIAASFIIVDFGRRVVECRDAYQTISARLSDINNNYWLFKREP